MLERNLHVPARLPADHPPVLVIVVDTEEEFDWGRPFSRDNTATRSIAAQPLIHERIFDRHGIVPTYCIDWPVATTPSAVATLRRSCTRLGRTKIDGRSTLAASVSP